MPRRVAFFLPCIVIVFAAPVGAQPQPPLRFHEQVVVTPGRTESTLDRVPAFVTLIDESDITDSPAGDIPGLLRQAGLHVVDVTGNQRSSRVDLRGFGATAGSNTLVLVDGRRVNQPDLSGSDWSQIPLDRVARIEVIRGAGGTVLFGDNASGGVVNIITKDGNDRRSTAALRVGSFSTWTPDVSSSGTKGRVSYLASGRYHRSEGHRENAQTKGGDLGGRLSVRTDSRFELGVSAGYHGDTTGLPGALTEATLEQGTDRSASVTPDDFAKVDDGYLMATPRFLLGRYGYALVDLSARQRDTRFFSSFSGGEFTGDTGTRTLGASPRVVLQGALGPTANHLVAGFDMVRAEEDVRNAVTFGGVPDVGLFTLTKMGRGVYVSDELRAGVLTVTGGYRYDGADYTFTPSTPAERRFRAHVGSVGTTVKVDAEISLYARVSRSFRYPVLDELFDFFSNTIVTDLLPQQSLDIEGGVRIEVASVRAGVGLFRMNTDREIFFNPVGGFGFGANENLDGESRRTGLELTASTLIGVVEFGGSYTLLDAAIQGGGYSGQEMPGVPRHRGTIQGRMPLADRVSLGLEGLYTGRRRFEGDFDGVFGEQDAHFLIDAKVTYRQGRARLFADLKNLLDEEYDEYGVLGGFPTGRAFYPSPGRHAFVGVEVTF